MAEGRDVVRLDDDKRSGASSASPGASPPPPGSFDPVSSEAQARQLLGGPASGGGTPGRLGSIRARPDLTLGSAAKAKFKPKVPARRKVRQPKAEPTAEGEGGAARAGSARGGARGGARAGGGAGGRGRGGSEFKRRGGRRPPPQSQTVFGAGSFAKPTARRGAVRNPAEPSSAGKDKASSAKARQQEQARADAQPVDFGESAEESGAGAAGPAKVKVEGQGSAELQLDSGDEDDGDGDEFAKYFGAAQASGGRRGSYPPAWLPLSKPAQDTVPPPTGAGTPRMDAQFAAAAKLQSREEQSVGADFTLPARQAPPAGAAEAAAAAPTEGERLFFMQMPSHLPLQHFTPPESLRPEAGSSAAQAVDLEADDIAEGGKAARAEKLQQAMREYESHHGLEPLTAYEKDPARREEWKRRSLHISDSAAQGIGVEGWAARSTAAHSAGEVGAPGSYLRQPAVPSGKIGKLRIHKSGRVTMKIGEVVYEVGRGTPVGFPQLFADYQPPGAEDPINLDLEEEEGSGQGALTVLGAIPCPRPIC